MQNRIKRKVRINNNASHYYFQLLFLSNDLVFRQFTKIAKDEAIVGK